MMANTNQKGITTQPTTGDDWEIKFNKAFILRPFGPDGDWVWSGEVTPWKIKDFIRDLLSQKESEVARKIADAAGQAGLAPKELTDPEDWKKVRQEVVEKAELAGVGKVLDILWTNSINTMGEKGSNLILDTMKYYFGENWSTDMYKLITKNGFNPEQVKTLKELSTKDRTNK